MTTDPIDQALRTTPYASRFTQYSLFIILSVFVALALLYSIATPIFEGPDEIWHFTFANHLANGGDLPVFDATQPATALRDGAHPPLYYWLVAAVIAPIDRSDFPDQFHFNLASRLITPGGKSDQPNLLIHTAREDFPYRNATLAAHLGRLISIVLGVLTIIGVWKVAHVLLPDRDRLAIAATALAAFVPQFVYGSAMINNDALAAASAAWLLLALLRLMKEQSIRWLIISGLLLGIALLSKIGMIAILPLPAIALLLAEINRSAAAVQRKFQVTEWLKSVRWKKAIVNGLIIYGVALAVAGWWYLRNLNLYGDLLAWKEWQALTGVGRVPPSIGDFIHDMIGLFGLFWADFSLRVDRTWWWIFGLLGLAALGGYARRARRHDWPSIDWRGWWLALIWLGLLLVLLIRYSFAIYDIHGRGLYPALATIGVVLVVGLSGWGEIVGRRLIVGAIGGLVSINLIVPFSVINPAYAPPIVGSLPVGVTASSENFGDVQLLGYQIKGDRVQAGDSIEALTYWRLTATRSISSAIGVLVLSDATGAVVEHADTTLGTDIYPSWAWRSNEIIETKFTLPVSVAESSLVNVNLSVQGVDRSFQAGRIVVTNPQPCQIDRAADVTFGGSIKLIGYQIDQSNVAGVPSRVVLCWQSIKPTPIDYTVFVHVTDARGAAFTSDAQPRNGIYPTSAWAVGDQIQDSHPLPAVVDLMIKQVSIGLYRLDTGERLTIDGTNETEFVIPNSP
jgi:4-amino-4-deoxy-L-arabinose transferase-like glycosyltransferase